MLGWGRQSEGGGWHFLPESLPLPHPYPNQQLSPSPAHPRWKSRQQRPEAPEGGRGKPTDGQAEPPPIRVWPAGRGGGCGALTSMPSAPRGPLKSPRCQAGQGVCRGPCILGACCHPPGLPGLGTRPWEAAVWSLACLSLALFSLTPFLPLSSLFFLPPSLSPSASVLCSFSPLLSPILSSFHLSTSFIPVLCTFSFQMPFWSLSFSSSLLLFFSSSFILCHLALPVSHSQPPKCSNSGTRGSCVMPQRRLPLPL